MPKLISTVAAGAALFVSSAASADIFIDVIDRGVPTDGTTTMDGFRGFTLRVRSDSPITQILMDNGRVQPGPLGLGGDLHQRWTDPTGMGNYTVTSPLDPAQNLTPSVMNFDSHVLPVPPEADVLYLGEVDPLFDQRIANSPLASTPFVGYADPPDIPGPFYSFLGGFVEVNYSLPASANVTEIEVAYLVTDSVAGFGLGVRATNDSINLVDVIYAPEPGGLTAASVGCGLLLRRHRRDRHEGVAFEALEPRRMLSVDAPVPLTATADPTEIQLDWPDVTGATGYRVERSTDVRDKGVEC